MKKMMLVALILGVCVSSFGQWTISSAKNRWGNGYALSSKDTANFKAAGDTLVFLVSRDSTLYFRFKGSYKPLAYYSGANGFALLNGQNDFSQRQRMFNSLVVYNGIFSTFIFAQSVGSATPGIGAWLGVGDSVTKRSWNLQLNTSGALDFNYYNGFTNSYKKRASLDSLGILTATGFTQSLTNSNTFIGPTTIGQLSDNSLGSPVGYGVVNGSLLLNGYGANGLNAIAFNNSGGDQFLSSQFANNSYSKGIATGGGTYLWKDYSGGAAVRGAVTEGEAVKMHLVIGGASGKEFWYDAANSRNVWLIDYGNQLVTSYFPITTTAKVTAGTLSVTDRATISTALRVGTTTTQLGPAETGTFYNSSSSFPISAVSTAQSVGTIGSWNTATAGDNVFNQFYTEGSPTLRGSISYNRGGGLVAYNTTSDRRSKNILGTFNTSGAMIDSINIYRAIMKGATIERPMVIADELETVAPFAVTGTKNAIDAKGNPIYQQVDYQSLIPLLISEIKSLRERVAKLENK